MALEPFVSGFLLVTQRLNLGAHAEVCYLLVVSQQQDLAIILAEPILRAEAPSEGEEF